MSKGNRFNLFRELFSLTFCTFICSTNIVKGQYQTKYYRNYLLLLSFTIVLLLFLQNTLYKCKINPLVYC